jgi:hypothetical protein
MAEIQRQGNNIKCADPALLLQTARMVLYTPDMGTVAA